MNVPSSKPFSINDTVLANAMAFGPQLFAHQMNIGQFGYVSDTGCGISLDMLNDI